jgi:hypothetical protein
MTRFMGNSVSWRLLFYNLPGKNADMLSRGGTCRAVWRRRVSAVEDYRLEFNPPVLRGGTIAAASGGFTGTRFQPFGVTTTRCALIAGTRRDAVKAYSLPFTRGIITRAIRRIPAPAGKGGGRPGDRPADPSVRPNGTADVSTEETSDGPLAREKRKQSSRRRSALS